MGELSTTSGQRLPSGTVTFLFTDIEGSTKLARAYPETWEILRARHHAILQSAMEANNGYVFQIIGDAFCAAFHTVRDGLCAAIDAQRNLQTEKWGPNPVKVRMGLHTGSAEHTGSDYRGYLTMAKVQRVMSVAYGGQVLLSNASAELLHDELPSGITLRDMKEHRLKGLPEPERLWQMSATDLQHDFPPLQTAKEIPNNLPLQLTSFIGREKEVEQVKKRLEKNRLVTLTGSGGVGKTRLSIQVASELLNDYPHGVCLVELAPVTDPALVERTFCAALDISPQGSTPALQVLTEFLKPRNILLTIDNCEHLIDACAQLCDSILHTCPDVRILASSREALDIDGENAYRVPSLSLPQPNDNLPTIGESEAVKLFVERAKETLPDFEISEINASRIAQICKRLDGIPLAIELAASRVKVLKVEQIAARLDDVFRLLTGGSRTALPRQQTLRAMIDWSYNLLSEKEQVVFRSLAVFAGGWTLEAAETVCNNPNMLDILTHLVGKSLVSVDYEHGDEARYYFLETIRQYAREKLAESGAGETLREKHAHWLMELSERAEPKLSGHGQLEWFKRMENEIDNLRAALEWCLYNNSDMGLRIINALWRFWDNRSHQQECIQYVEKLWTAGALDPSPLHARAMVYAAWEAMSPTTKDKMDAFRDAGEAMARQVGDLESLALSICILAIGEHWQGEHARALALFEESAALYDQAGNVWGKNVMLGGIGYASQALGDHERAREAYRELLAFCRENGDDDFRSFALMNLGLLTWEQDDYERALNCFQESLSLEVNGKSMRARILQMAAEMNLLLGRYGQAENLLKESIALEREMWIQWDPARGFQRLGRVARLQGNYDLAVKNYTESLRLAQKHDLRQSLAWSLASLAELAALKHQTGKAVILLGAAESIKELTDRLFPTELSELEQISGTVRNQVDDESFKPAYETGSHMSLDQVISYALEGTQK